MNISQLTILRLSLPVAAFFSFALGIARPCVHQLNAQQSAGTFHPVRPVLRTVVEIEALRRSVFHNSLVKRIFHNRFRHVAVEFAMENHAGGIVNQARKVGRGGKPVITSAAIYYHDLLV